MNICTVVSLVPETDVNINIEDKKFINVSNNKFIINPLDEFAIEEAVRTKEKLGGEVRAIIYSVSEHIENDELLARSILARGVDSAVLIRNISCYSQKNIAKNIINLLDDFKPEMIFSGYKNTFWNSTELPVFIAGMLNYNYCTGITQLEFSEENKIICKKEIEAGYNLISMQLPVVLSVHKGLNEPRYPKLVEIMKAKKKPLEIKEACNYDDCLFDIDNVKLVQKERNKIVLTDSDEDINKLAEFIKSKL